MPKLLGEIQVHCIRLAHIFSGSERWGHTTHLRELGTEPIQQVHQIHKHVMAHHQLSLQKDKPHINILLQKDKLHNNIYTY